MILQADAKADSVQMTLVINRAVGCQVYDYLPASQPHAWLVLIYTA